MTVGHKIKREVNSCALRFAPYTHQLLREGGVEAAVARRYPDRIVDGVPYVEVRPGCIITYDGLDYVDKRQRRGGAYSETVELPDRAQVAVAQCFIVEACRLRARPNRGFSSYTWKHAAETWRQKGDYVSNGSFIQAAVELGVPIWPAQSGSINAYLPLVLTRDARLRI